MYFKVYRDHNLKTLRKIVVALYSADGKFLDQTLMFGYGSIWILKHRLKVRKRQMLRLQAALKD